VSLQVVLDLQRFVRDRVGVRVDSFGASVDADGLRR
jgi:hypothetical protein